MEDYADFYEEYRTKALTRPFTDPDTMDTVVFVQKRVEHWREICRSKGRLEPDEYESYFETFGSVLRERFPEIPLVFSHGHLTGSDIRKEGGDRYVLLRNIFFSWRPRHYDAAFNLWACPLHIRDNEYSFEKLRAYIEKWLDVYQQIPVLRGDPDFDRNMYAMLLERTIGSILADLGATENWEKEDAPYFRHILDLHQKLFEYYLGKIA